MIYIYISKQGVRRRFTQNKTLQTVYITSCKSFWATAYTHIYTRRVRKVSVLEALATVGNIFFFYNFNYTALWNHSRHLKQDTRTSSVRRKLRSREFFSWNMSGGSAAKCEIRTLIYSVAKEKSPHETFDEVYEPFLAKRTVTGASGYERCREFKNGSTNVHDNLTNGGGETVDFDKARPRAPGQHHEAIICRTHIWTERFEPPPCSPDMAPSDYHLITSFGAHGWKIIFNRRRGEGGKADRGGGGRVLRDSWWYHKINLPSHFIFFYLIHFFEA